jgi:hypothetical protein
MNYDSHTDDELLRGMLYRADDASSSDDSDEADELKKRLEELFPKSKVQLRETGRVIRAQVTAEAPTGPLDLNAIWPGEKDRAWRFAQLSFVPPGGSRHS